MQKMAGQGSSEYLIILAVVLIIALVAIALLGAFPSLGSDSRVTETRQYWSSAHPFAILDWKQEGTVMTITMKNMAPDPLTLTNITIGNATNSTSITFNGGAVKTITISGLRACNATTYDYYEYTNVSIVYSTSKIGYNRFVGLKPLVGPCIEAGS